MFGQQTPYAFFIILFCHNATSWETDQSAYTYVSDHRLGMWWSQPMHPLDADFMCKICRMQIRTCRTHQNYQLLWLL